MLDRYYHAARAVRADAVVRVTGDCPLIDAQLVDAVIAMFGESQVDYCSNIQPPTYPDGLDTEVMTMRALESAWRLSTAAGHREHVTQYIRESGRFTVLNYAHDSDESAERWTVDEPEDLEVVRKVFEHFDPRRDFGWLEVLELRGDHPEYFARSTRGGRPVSYTHLTLPTIYSV